jgi:hypothetical protein
LKSTRERTTEELQRLLDRIESPNGKISDYQLRDLRSAILGDQLALFYHERGEKAIGKLYQSTMNPNPVGKPSQVMVESWGPEANKVQALLETLKRDFKFTFDERTRKTCSF